MLATDQELSSSVAGLTKKVKAAPNLKNFGFIPSKRVRGTVDEDVVVALGNLIVDVEQVIPVNCLVPACLAGIYTSWDYSSGRSVPSPGRDVTSPTSWDLSLISATK